MVGRAWRRVILSGELSAVGGTDVRLRIETAIDAFRGRNPAPASFEAFAEDCIRLASTDPLNDLAHALVSGR